MRKELGKWFMDVAKYMCTALFISDIFLGIKANSYLYAIVVSICVIVLLIIGLALIKKSEK